MARSAVHPVTIIVPVYGDLPSLLDCVESLRRNVDRSIHRILLVNDCGPEADEIHDALVLAVGDEPGFAIERNEHNLGFVGTCNRAVLELDHTDNDVLLLNSDTETTAGFLDELARVLYASPLHGAVCPRSNNATIASLPFRTRDASAARNTQRTAEVYAAVRNALPPFSVAPVAMGFCILIRRDVIRSFGLFDEIFAPGYGEENDFCLRIARDGGFLSVIANHALVFHLGARSFVSARREALRAAHENILTKRYPGYSSAVQTYLYETRDPVDVFADALVPSDAIIRILIDLDSDSRDLDESMRALLQAAASIADRAVTVTVATGDRSLARVRRQFPSLTVVRQSRLDGVWDVAIADEGHLSPGQLARLNRTSLRIAFLGEPSALGRHIPDVRYPDPVPAAVLDDLTRRWGRSVIDTVRLRGRWVAITAQPDRAPGTTWPSLGRAELLLRRARSIAPAPTTWARGLLRRLTGR
jgi:GT2 family glycosyltransferase